MEIKDKVAKVVLAARSAEELKKLEKEIPNSFAVPTDMRNHGDILNLMQAVIPLMRAEGGGLILNVSSMVSKNYYPCLAAYASTTYALNALTLTARQELEPDHIVVSLFHPKMTATDFGQNSAGEKYDSRAGRPGMSVDTPEEVAVQIAGQIESEEPEANM